MVVRQIPLITDGVANGNACQCKLPSNIVCPHVSIRCVTELTEDWLYEASQNILARAEELKAVGTTLSSSYPEGSVVIGFPGKT